MIVRKRGAWAVLGALVVLAGSLSMFIYREVRQERLDRGLIAAIRRGDPIAVKAVLDAGSNPDTIEIQPPSSVWSYYRDFIDRLRNRGKRSSQADQPTALMLAVKSGKADIVAALLARGASGINAQVDGVWDIDKEPIRLPLLAYAAFHGNIPMVELLLDRAAIINEGGDGGMTALTAAAYQGHLPLVNLLLRRGAKVNIKNDSGYSVLVWAFESGNIGVVKTLLRHGASINAKNEEGRTVIMEVVQWCDDDTVKFFVRRGADLNAKDDEGQSVLEYVPGARPDRATYLIKAGAK